MLSPGSPDAASHAEALVAFSDQMEAQGDSDLALRFVHRAADTDLGHRRRREPEEPGAPGGSAGLVRRRERPDAVDLQPDRPLRHTAVLIERASTFAPHDVDADTAYLVGAALNLAGAFSLSPAFLASAATSLRAEGRLRQLVEVLSQQAWSAFTSLDWAVAVPAADEGLRLARETDQPFWAASCLTAKGILAGARGDVDEAEQLTRAAEAIALPMAANPMLCGIQLSRGITAISAGKYDEAFAQLHRMFVPGDPSYHHFQSAWAVGDLAEAALNTGNLDAARDELALFDIEGPTEVFTWPAVALAMPVRSSPTTATRKSCFATPSWPTSRVGRCTGAASCSPTAAGCAGSGGQPTHVHRCVLPAKRSTRWERVALPSKHAASPAPPGNAAWNPRRRPGETCLLRSCRSLAWPPKDCPTGRSRPVCTSRTERWGHISTASTRSSASPREPSSRARWRRTRRPLLSTVPRARLVAAGLAVATPR